MYVDALNTIKQRIGNFQPQIGVILGSGLAEFANNITNPIVVPYDTIPGLAASQVPGHASALVFGYIDQVPIVCCKGRLHLYEGISHDTLKLLIGLIKLLGCQILVVTGAVGSLRPDLEPGSLILINDHINMQGSNPLIGPNDASIGPRFVSLEDAYDPDLRSAILAHAAQIGITLTEGVYLATIGPVFETPAEIAAFRMLGADVVGMSVVPEVILARHAGLAVLGIAGITNFAVGLSKEAVTHDLTLKNGVLIAHKLSILLTIFVTSIGTSAKAN